jgi:hypothetical protein
MTNEEQIQRAIMNLSELTSAMGHLKELYRCRDSSSCETAMIGLLADRLQTVTREFYNLEEIMLAG